MARPSRRPAAPGRIVIAAVGRARDGPVAALYRHYAERISLWRLDLVEIDVRLKLPPDRMTAEEGLRLLAAIPDDAAVVALDESGENTGSTELARRLQSWRQDGRTAAFLIGGADGLAKEVRARADWRLAFGRATWPHLLVRGLLAEQIYRAQQILASHPYHRE